MTNKQKHLEFIQAVITRMSSNLFMLKGWTVTLIVALFTFIAKGGNNTYILFSYFVLIIFWILDGYFLSKERCFRKLYNNVRKKSEKEINFSMNYKRFEKGKNTWMRSIFSKTLIIFYGTLLFVTSIVALSLNTKNIFIHINFKKDKCQSLFYEKPIFDIDKQFFFKEIN